MQLIKDGKAFVCHQSSEEIAASREAKTPSPWRDRPPEESLKLFEDMRRGLVDEGKATLRFVGDGEDGVLVLMLARGADVRRWLYRHDVVVLALALYFISYIPVAPDKRRKQ